jgi:CHAD domain-containing protein
MKQPGLQPQRRAFAAQALLPPLHALNEQIDGVRQADDVEFVHRMRVASRRVRNAMGLFFDELPPRARSDWLKRIKRITRALGAARDLDVQIAFLSSYLSRRSRRPTAVRPGVEHVLATLTAQRHTAQRDVVRAMDRLEDSQTLKRMLRWANRRGQWTAAALRTEARQVLAARVADVWQFEPYIDRPECISELHAMRIAAKHLRYTMEVFAPLFRGGLATEIAWTRGLQDALGALHDCDAWIAVLPQFLDGATTPALVHGITHLAADRRTERTRLYGQLVTAWHRDSSAVHARLQRLTKPPSAPRFAARPVAPRPFDPAADPQLAPALTLARECKFEAEHATHVTGLALELFDQLRDLHGLGAAARHWLAGAGLLHDIGWVAGRAGHHKTALRLILESPRLPWPSRLRQIIGSIARYHRGAAPRIEHAAYASLSAKDRAAVCTLGGLLRLADGLDYSHRASVQHVQCTLQPGRIAIACLVSGPAEADVARGRKKSDLARAAFSREIDIQ